jgi:DivIVA domain-containing protein
MKRAILSIVNTKEPAGPTGSETEDRPPRPSRKRPVGVAERTRMHDDIRKVDFPVAVRGYDRAAVDRYVKQVNSLIAELETSASPEGAIKRALEEVSEETRGILERAHETADAIASRSRVAADDRLEQAEREAAEMRDVAEREARELRDTTAREVEELRGTAQREAEEKRAEAETRVQKLDRHAEAVWQERRRLVDDLRTVGQQLLETADNAAARFPPVAEAAARGELSPGGESAAGQKLAAPEKQPASTAEGPGPG